MENKMTFADLRRQNKKLLRQNAGLKKRVSELEECCDQALNAAKFYQRMMSENYLWYCRKNRVARISAIWWRDQFFRADAENRRLRVELNSIAITSKSRPLPPVVDGEYLEITTCPKCGHLLRDTFWISGGTSFCPYCGQVIDWGCE